jgi:alkylated DNA repair protein (DNA oxidative demethylase)
MSAVRPEHHEQGFAFYPGYLDRESQRAILAAVERAAGEAPFFTPVMPRTARPFTVQMTNLGSLGWVSDRGGYR